MSLCLILLLHRGGVVDDDDFVDGPVVGDNGGDDVTSLLTLYSFFILKQSHSINHIIFIVSQDLSHVLGNYGKVSSHRGRLPHYGLTKGLGLSFWPNGKDHVILQHL